MTSTFFNPNSFSDIPLQNSRYIGGINPRFPQIDPVQNPADRTYGLLRNALRGPHLTNLDLGLAKTTSISERVKIELRMEDFNALNHPEFAQLTLVNNATNINGQSSDKLRPRFAKRLLVRGNSQ